MKWFVLALFVAFATTAEASMRQQPAAAPVHAGAARRASSCPISGR